MNHYLFVVRNYNDLDNFIPLLDTLSKEKIAKVSIFSSTNNLFFNHNESAIFLKKEYSIEIQYIFGDYENFAVAILERLFVFIEKSTSDIQLSHRQRVLINVILKNFYRLILKCHKKYYNDWDKVLIEEEKPNVIIYDYRNARSFPVSLLTKRANLASIPIVGMPHGLLTFTNSDFENTPMTRISRNLEVPITGTISGLDYVITANDIDMRHRKNLGFDDNFYQLGSLRYEKKWIKRMNTIYQSQYSLLPNNSDSLKVAIFPSKLLYRGNAEMINGITASVCRLFDNVVIKPHTRGMKLEFMQEVLKSNSLTIANNNQSSQSIIEWCDLAIVWSSSIGLHVLVEGKMLLNPSFATENSTIYDEFLPDCTSSNLEEFIQHLESMKKNKKAYYDDNQVNNILNEFVYFRDMNSTVVSRYVEFLSGITKTH